LVANVRGGGYTGEYGHFNIGKIGEWGGNAPKLNLKGGGGVKASDKPKWQKW